MNRKVFDFFSQNAAPGFIGLTGSSDLLGLAIREAQRSLTGTGKPSLWSHSFIFGAERQDRRGPNGSWSQSRYVFESTIDLNLQNPQLRNGAQENWLGRVCGNDVERAAIIDFKPTPIEVQKVLASALQLASDQILYPVQELIGSLWAIISRREWEQNILDDPHAMFCSAYCRYNYVQAGYDFMGGLPVAVSNTAPEHIAQAGMRTWEFIEYRP